jgi:HlyD family secretion protein
VSTASARPAGWLLLLVPSLALNVALGGLGAYLFLVRPPVEPAPSEPPASQPADIKAQARLQPSGGLLAVYAPPGDRIDKLRVEQGEQVQKGYRLFRLASHRERSLEAKLAASQYDEALRLRKALLENGSAQVALLHAERSKLLGARKYDEAAQREKVRVLRSQHAQAQRQLNRITRLDRRKVEVSAQELEQQRLLLRQAEGELWAAEALLHKTTTGYERSLQALEAKLAAVKAETNQAVERVPVGSAEQNLALARRRADLTEVRAPVAGRVVRLLGHEGEAIGQQPVLELAAGGGLVAVAEVPDSSYATLRSWLNRGGVKVEVSGSALPELPRPLAGELRGEGQVAGVVARNRLISLNPRADVDLRVFEVRVDLDLTDTPSWQTDLLVGLQVDVTLRAPAP